MLSCRYSSNPLKTLSATDEVFRLEIGDYGLEFFFYAPLTSKTNLA